MPLAGDSRTCCAVRDDVVSRGAAAAARCKAPRRSPDLEVVAASVEQIPDLLVVHLYEATFGAVSEGASQEGSASQGSSQEGTASVKRDVSVGTYSTLSSKPVLILSKM